MDGGVKLHGVLFTMDSAIDLIEVGPGDLHRPLVVPTARPVHPVAAGIDDVVPGGGFPIEALTLHLQRRPGIRRPGQPELPTRYGKGLLLTGVKGSLQITQLYAA